MAEREVDYLLIGGGMAAAHCASELRSRFNLFPLALILTMLVAWAVPFGTPAAAAYSALYALLLVVAFHESTILLA